MTSEKYPTLTLEQIYAECDRVSERVSKMSNEERQRYYWVGVAMAYGFEIKLGENPNRIKAFRRKFRKNQLWNEKHQKECRKDRQRKGLNPAKKAREYMRSRIPFK
jgi:hypothetical protein